MDDEHTKELQQFKDEVKPFLTEPYLLEWCDDACCLRYLEAREWRVNDAIKLIKSTINWRIEKRPEITSCPLCPDDPFSHNFRMIGFDSTERPVLYTCFSQASRRFDVPGNITHLCKTLEDTSVIMKKTGVGRWVWLIDFDGFGVYDCSVPMMNQTIQLIDHYPARLGKLVLLDSPWLFSGLWKTISPLLPPATKTKIVFVSRKEIDTTLKPVLGDELTAWLKKEMEENRKKKGKKYWEWKDEEGNALPHDPRGAPSYVGGPHYVLPVRHDHCSSLLFERKNEKETQDEAKDTNEGDAKKDEEDEKEKDEKKGNEEEKKEEGR